MKKRVNLSISNFNKKKKNILKVIIFILLFFIINNLIGHELATTINDTNRYSEIKWEEFYEQSNNNIDLVFLGSSHAYRSFDPELFDKELKINSFNMGSPLQKPVESYYVLKEVLKYQKPKMIIFDVYWGMFNKETYFKTKTWNYDLMKPSFNKLNYLLHVFEPKQYFYALFPSVRYHDKLSQYIKKKLFASTAASSKTGEYIEKYKGKGFVINKQQTSKKELEELFKGAKKQNLEFIWDERQMNYFIELIKLCKNENVPLLLVTAPMAPTYLKEINEHRYNYNEIHNKVSNIAKEYNLKYIDFNKINMEKDFLKDKDFSDSNHLNYKGAHKLNIYFLELIKQSYEDVY
ncbi:MAG: DUF1574 domain-containing protein [Firmicutes bacterium]|nr:DUF1574 domain-containing protein [Bacillota bacterium]